MPLPVGALQRSATWLNAQQMNASMWAPMKPVKPFLAAVIIAAGAANALSPATTPAVWPPVAATSPVVESRQFAIFLRSTVVISQSAL